MKAKKSLMRIIIACTLMGLIFSCSDGEDGAIGPQGTQGEQGLPGEQGETGEQGEQGETGTANVIYSEWIPRDFETNVAAETNTQLLETFNLVEFNLAEDVLLVYGRREVNVIVSEISPLPYILASQDEYYGFQVSNFVGGSSLRIQVSTLDGGTNLFTFFDDFRYVIIPGGVAKSSIDYASMSYEEIVELFNISKE